MANYVLITCAVVFLVLMSQVQGQGKDNVVHGAAAVAKLGSKLDRVAHKSHFGSEAKLKAALMKDQDLGVDKVNGDGSMLLYACTGQEAYISNQERRRLLDDHASHHHHPTHKHSNRRLSRHDHHSGHGHKRTAARLPSTLVRPINQLGCKGC